MISAILNRGYNKMELTTLNVIAFLLSMFAGCFFAILILTFIEHKSSGFRRFTDVMCSVLPSLGWTILSAIALVGSSFLIVWYTSLGCSRGGVLAGAIGGICLYFKAGTKAYDPSYGENDDKTNAKAKRSNGKTPNPANRGKNKKNHQSGR